MKNKKWIIAVIVAVIIVIFMIFIFICQRTAAPEKKRANIKEFEALTDINPDLPDVYLIVKALNSNYWDTITKYVANAAKMQGCNLYYSGSEVEADVEVQILLLQQAAEAGADAIIIAPDDSLALSEPIAKLHQQGMPVVLIDTTITTDDYDVCFMTDNLLAGQKAAEEMLAQLRRKGCKEDEFLQIAIQVGLSSSQTINERLGGFTKYWSANAPEKWEIIDDVKVNYGNLDTSLENANSFLCNYSDIKGMFGCNNGSTVGFAKAIKANSRTDVAIVGFDYSDEIAELIENPDYGAATILQRQDRMGNRAVRSALDLIDGKSSEVKFVDTGITIVNKENIQTEEVQKIINAE